MMPESEARPSFFEKKEAKNFCLFGLGISGKREPSRAGATPRPGCYDIKARR
jgi:hypothetical protein